MLEGRQERLRLDQRDGLGGGMGGVTGECRAQTRMGQVSYGEKGETPALRFSFKNRVGVWGLRPGSGMTCKS